MKPNHIRTLLAILSLTLAGLACQMALPAVKTPAETPGAEVPTAASVASAATAAPAAAAPVEPATMTSSGPGLLCAGTQAGLSCLNEKGWQVYTSENSKLPGDYLYAGAVCPDGSLAIAHGSGISLFDGKDWKQIPATDAYSSPDGLACEADGGLWVAHFKGVSHYAKGQWTTYGSEKLGSGESASELVYAVQVAPDGKVWVLSARSVALFEKDAWTIFQEGQGFEGSRFFNALTLDAKGRPWAAHSGGVDVFDNGTWHSYNKTDFNTPESLALDAKGQVWLGSLSGGAFMFNGNSWAQYNRASESLASDTVRAVAADGSGRVWFGTSYGLTVFDGSTWRTLAMSNSDIGDNDIKFLLLTKDGPALPALQAKATASLTGKLRDADKKPLAGVQVQICVETLGTSFTGDTPCSDQPFFLSTKTDETGAFTFENVPPGYYVIVSETGSSWAQLTDQFGISSQRLLLTPGEKHDLETLTLEKK